MAGHRGAYDDPMDRRELQCLSRLRAKDAQCLLNAGHAQGAYYLMGYSVECALKAVIAAHQRPHVFPDKAFAFACHTHDLRHLLVLAGLRKRAEAAILESQAFELNWNTVREWSESRRYDVDVSIRMARTLIAACVQRPRGVLPWIQTFW